jgi:hypothetical protein
MSHTKGPWRVVEENKEFVVEAENGCVAVVGATLRASTVEVHERSKANARLIAASPALLEACKLALADRERMVGGTHADPYRSDAINRDALVISLRSAISLAEKGA